MGDQFYPGFAGEDLHQLWLGDVVKVIEGKNIGSTGIVEDVRGHAYDMAQRIYIKFPGGGFTWYWPWNLEIVSRKKRGR